MAPAPSKLLAIGEVASQAGVAPSALRFYERAGLLPAPVRESGRRRYDRGIIHRLAVIDVAKRAGFSLDEIRELLEDFDGGMPSSERWQQMAARKLPEIDALIQDAQRMRRLLTDGLSSVRLAGGPWGYPSPFAYRRGLGLTLVSLLFDTLVWRVPTGELRPWLARTWTPSEDGTEHRFALRDVRWHDGRRVTAEDVAVTFELLASIQHRRDPIDMMQRRGLAAVRDVRVDGPRALTIMLHRPYAAFADVVAGRVPIVPAHVWAHVEDPVALRGADAVLGSGPYVLESCDEVEGRYRYRANDAYFLGRPYLHHVELAPVADELAALEQGLIDVAVFVSDAGRPRPSALERFDNPQYHVQARPGEWTRALFFDQRPPSPYADRRIRHAFAYAIDREALVADLLGGRGVIGSTGGLGPSHPLLATGLPDYPPDLPRARDLLDEAGLVRPPGAGTRLRDDGRPWRPELLTDDGDRGAAKRVAADLRRVDVDVQVVRRPRVECDDLVTAGRYELALVGHGSLGGDPDLLRLRLSARIPATGRTIVRGYRSARFEQLADAQSTALDADQRAVLVHDLQRVVAADLPMLALYVPDQLTVSPVKQIFSAWESTPGGVWGGYPGPLNKEAFVRGPAT